MTANYNRKLLSRELTDASKVEDEIKKILSELQKLLTSQPATDKGQNNRLVTWYDVFCSDISEMHFGAQLTVSFSLFLN